MSNTLTIRARTIEGVNHNTGHGFPDRVELTGGKFLSYGAALEIAQEAVNTIYGEYETGWLATLNHNEWDQYRINDATKFTLKVVAV